MHTCVHLCKLVHTCPCSHVHTYAHSCTPVHTCACTLVHVPTYTLVHCARVHTCAHLCTRVHTSIPFNPFDSRPSCPPFHPLPALNPSHPAPALQLPPIHATYFTHLHLSFPLDAPFLFSTPLRLRPCPFTHVLFRCMPCTSLPFPPRSFPLPPFMSISFQSLPASTFPLPTRTVISGKG